MNYYVEGILLLLEEDRILKCYIPLIPCKHQLVRGLHALGCRTRDDCLALSDVDLYAAGLPDGMAGLFRRFLRLYDYKGKGVRDIPDASSRSPEEVASLLELMNLPGVQATRAQLYYHCGFLTLADFAQAEVIPLQAHIASIIARDKLTFSVPQPKELRTQITVARVFTKFAAP